MANSDFAPWLKNRILPDPALTRLRAFADAHAAQWPYYSNRMADYVRVVQAANDPNEEALLTTLEQYFLAWNKTRDGWLGIVTQFSLLAAGLIVVLIIFWALFKTNLITVISDANQARGLITFLFSFITIAVIFVVVIAVLWMEKDEDIDARFGRAKDIITILVGILGTIIGFYFGNTSPGPAPVIEPQTTIQPPPPTAPPPGTAAPPMAPGTPQGSSAVSPADNPPPATNAVPPGSVPPAAGPEAPQQPSATPTSDRSSNPSTAIPAAPR